MGFEAGLKIAKEISDIAIKEIGKKVGEDGTKVVFNKELAKNIVESLKEKYLESPQEVGEAGEKIEVTEAKERLEKVEDKVDVEPEKVKENPEPVVKELSAIGDFLNEIKEEVEIFRELTNELKGLQTDVKNLIGEENYNKIASSLVENLVNGTGGSDMEELDEAESE